MTNQFTNPIANQDIIVGRKLMQNEFICPVSDSDSFEWLKVPKNFEIISQHLAFLGVAIVDYDEQVYCGVNIAINEDDKNKVVKQFEQILTQIAPIVDLLVALSQADEMSDTLYMGKILKFDELLLAVNQNKIFETRLHEFMQGTTAYGKPNDVQIEALLKKMHNDKLIFLTNPSHRVYKVTGKITYINRIIAFINDNFIEKEPDTIAMQQGLDL